VAVNLEELAVESIRQYAMVSVRIESIEKTLIDNARKAEARDAQVLDMLTVLARIDEKLLGFIQDKKAIHDRIDEVKVDLNTLATTVQELVSHMITCKNDFVEHTEDHCSDCANGDRIDNLETTSEGLVIAVGKLTEKVDKLVSQDIEEVRGLITTKYGLQWLRFMISKYGLWWMLIVTAGAAVAYAGHYQWIKAVYKWFTFDSE